MPKHLEQVNHKVVSKILQAQQLDTLHFDLIMLEEMVRNNELDLILEQKDKSVKQKALYLEKVLDQVKSPELKEALHFVLREGELDLFSSKYFADFIKNLQKELEKIQVIRLQVAVSFESTDLRRMSEVLSRKMGRQIAFAVTEDKSLLGGAIIQIGNHIYDYTLKNRLDEVKSEWEKKEEKQATPEPIAESKESTPDAQ